MNKETTRITTDTKWVFEPSDDLTMKEVAEMFRVMSLSLTNDEIYDTISESLKRHFVRY